jgi:glycosyltransferase involved in cell wall biosynthesis
MINLLEGHEQKSNLHGGIHLAPTLERATEWPRITVVTPVLNGVRFIEDTIRSIVYQGYPNLEYIVVDGGSTDGTIDIIRKYQKHIAWWTSRRDEGVHDALNTGFAHSTGEIMGWLNASDLLHTSGLFVVGSVFASLPAVSWLTGRPTRLNPDGMTRGCSQFTVMVALSLSGGSQQRHPAGIHVLAQEPVGKSRRRDGRILSGRWWFRPVGKIFSPRAPFLRGCLDRRIPLSFRTPHRIGFGSLQSKMR